LLHGTHFPFSPFSLFTLQIARSNYQYQSQDKFKFPKIKIFLEV
jgi:hypothetical protein